MDEWIARVVVVLAACAAVAGVIMIYHGIWHDWRWAATGALTVLLACTCMKVAADLVD